MRLKTTDPVGWQLTLVIAASVLTGAFSAIVVSLASGVGAWAARAGPRTPLVGALPAWAAGAGAALFVAGASAFADSLVPSESPLWPSLTWQSAAWPLAAAALDGVAIVSSIGVALFLLYLLERATGGWTRRAWLALAVVVALIAGLLLVKAGGSRLPAASALVSGVLAAIVVYCVLRFDARAVPGYVVASSVIDGLENALLVGTAAGWEQFAVSSLVAIAIGVAATYYVARPLATPEPAPGAPPAPAE